MLLSIRGMRHYNVLTFQEAQAGEGVVIDQEKTQRYLVIRDDLLQQAA